MAVKPVPEGFHTVTPYLTVNDAVLLVDFIKRAFDAKEIHVMKGPNGEVWHGDLVIGDSHVMLGQANGPWPARPSTIYLYVPDADATYKQALAAGATSVQEPATQFYGDRHGAIKDCCDNFWWIATHVEDVPPEELERRAREAAERRTSQT